MSDPTPHPAASAPSSPPSSPPSSSAAGASRRGNGSPPKRYLCPYCGNVTADARRCSSCAGHLDPLSRQATQNTMGPWQIHDAASPFRPGCSFATVRKLIQKGQITRRTILRGPTTRQFWTFADRTPSVANLLGVCHNCHAEAPPGAFLCAACGASFTPETDRQYLGLAPRRPLPGEAPADQVAHLASDGPGLYAEPRRRDEADERGGVEGGGAGAAGRIHRPAFPADPRPSRPKRSPLAVIAIVAVAGAIGLSLGAAGALAVAWSVGMIDLTPDDEAVPPPPRGVEAGPAPEPGETPAGADSPASSATPEGDSGPAAPAAEPPGRGSDGPTPAESPPAEPPPAAPAAEPPPDPAPVVPPQLRRLP